MNPVSKALIGGGVALIGIGLLWQLAGKLPGDIAIEKPNFRFYFPLTTSILISVILSAIAWIVRYFSSK